MNEQDREQLRRNWVSDQQEQPAPHTPKFPGVHVQLTGTDGNILALAGRVDRAMRRAGCTNADVQDMINAVFDSESYDQALSVLMNTVDVS